MVSSINRVSCMRRAALLGTSALLLAMSAGQAIAQDADDSGSRVGDIVVTAQKREQNLQVVPISVVAVSEELLQANRVTSLESLQSIAPGVAIRKTVGGPEAPQLIIRGQLSANNGPGADGAVGILIDGVYNSATYGATFDIPDLQRVEILRGPQGTLFGRNSTAGAINFITRDPSGEFGARLEGTVGNYDQLRTVAHVETPSWGPFSAYVTYAHDEKRGDIRNLADPITFSLANATNTAIPRTRTTAKYLGGFNKENIRVAVKFAPSDDFSAVYKFDWGNNHFSAEGMGLTAFTPGNIGGFPIAEYMQANYPVPIAGIKRPKGVYNVWNTGGYSKASGHVLTMNYRVNDEISIKDILAYRTNFMYGMADYGGFGRQAYGYDYGPPVGPTGPGTNFPGPILNNGSILESHNKQWSNEFQINYDSQYLTLTTGALFFKSIGTAGSPEGLATASRNAYFPMTLDAQGNAVLAAGTEFTRANSRSLAGYAQAEIHVTPQIDLIGGLRVTSDRKSITIHSDGIPVTKRADVSFRKTKTTYELGANYRPTDDLMVYAKYATGYISGGNFGGVSYDPETVKSLEAGVKLDVLDDKVRFNLAVYQAKYANIQQGVPGSLAGVPELNLVVVNQGDSKVTGFEAEVTVVPTRGLTLSGSYTHNKFKWTKLRSFFVFITTPETFPHWLRPTDTANVSAAYQSQPIFGEATFNARIDGNYQSKVVTPGFFGVLPGQENIFRTGGDWIFNTRVALKDIALSGQAKAEVALWSRNMFNNKGTVWGGSQYYIGATSYVPARTFGLDVIFNY